MLLVSCVRWYYVYLLDLLPRLGLVDYIRWVALYPNEEGFLVSDRSFIRFFDTSRFLMIDGASRRCAAQPICRQPALLHSGEHGFVVCLRRTCLNILVRH